MKDEKCGERSTNTAAGRKKTFLIGGIAVAACALISGGIFLFGTRDGEPIQPAGENPTTTAKSEPIQPVGEYAEGMLVIQRGAKFGFMDTEGNLVVPCFYDEVTPFVNGSAQVKLDGGWTTINNVFAGGVATSKFITPVDCDYIGMLSEGLFPIAKFDSDNQQKLGYVDKNGKEVVPPIYDDADDFSEGLAAVGNLIGDDSAAYGFVDASGKEVVPLIYNNVDDFSEGLARVGKEDHFGDMKFGFIDKTGKMVVPAIYDFARNYSEGLAAVRNDAWKWGFIDKNSKEVIPHIYNGAEAFSEGLAQVAINDQDNNLKYGFIDKTGKEVAPPIYDTASNFSKGFAQVAITTGDDKMLYGFIDKTGKEISPLIYDYAGEFFEGIAMVGKATADGKLKYGFVDQTGKEIIPLDYDGAGYFSEGLAAVAKADSNGNLKYGFIDKTGKEITPLDYDGANIFSEGFAAVSKADSDGNLKYGFIDKTGKEIIPHLYDGAHYFSEGLSLVGVADYDGKLQYGFINQTGKEVIPFIYQMIGGFSEGVTTEAILSYRGSLEWFIISNPQQSSANSKAVPLDWGVFANPADNGYDRLENGNGDVLARFDDTLIQCNQYFAEGLMFLMKHEPENAAAALEKALELQPKNPHILQKLAESSKAAGNMQAYEISWSQYQQLVDDAAQAALQSGNPDTAFMMYTVLLVEAPREAIPYLGLAEIEIEQEYYEEARGILEIGYAATESEEIQQRLLHSNLEVELDLETEQVVAEGIMLVEHFTESADSTETAEFGNKLYDLLQQLF